MIDICPFILGPDFTVSQDLRGNGLWIVESAARHPRKMKKTDPRKLSDLLLHQLEARPPPIALLADLCSKIFEAPAWPGRDDSGRREGIWMDTQMADFQCRQCGRCCRELDFRHQLLETDYQRWIQSGLNDILEWVAVHRRGEKIISFSIWVVPGTLTFAAQCPWLRKTGIDGLWRCDIHDVKPEICRQYPGTRKHARMTGCSVFQTNNSL